MVLPAGHREVQNINKRESKKWPYSMSEAERGAAFNHWQDTEHLLVPCPAGMLGLLPMHSGLKQPGPLGKKFGTWSATEVSTSVILAGPLSLH